MKKIKILLIILCFLMILVSSINLTFSFDDEKTLYYNGNKKEFNYFNVSQNDLFSTFKNLMPGDTKEEKIKIKAINVNEQTNMYLNFDSSINNINYLNFEIYKDDTILYDSLKDGKKGLIKLSSFNGNDEFTLKVVLNVPKEAGNEIENLKTDLKLTFMVEVNEEQIEVPSTFDDSNIIINFIIMMVSLTIIVILLFNLKKQKKS